MKKLIAMLASAFTAFCVGTVIAQSVGIGMFVMRGGLEGNKKLQLLAVLHGLDLHEFWTEAEKASQVRHEDQMSYEEVLDERVKKSLDWDMRERAIDRGLSDLRLLDASYREERDKFVRERQKFIDELGKQKKQVADVALVELQETFLTMSPKQSKEQIKMWLEDPEQNYPIKDRDVMTDVVTILKTLPTDRTTKIFKEFKTADEAKMLHDILEHIRVGPQEKLIQDTKDEFNNSASRELLNRNR